MSQLQKLVKLFLSYPTEVRYQDAKRLLTAFGFEEVRSKGSHHIFRNQDGQILPIPKQGGKKVGERYIELIIEVLRLEEYDAQEKDD